MLNLIRTFILSVFLLVGCQGNNNTNPDSQSKDKERLPQIQLSDLNNQAVQLDNYKGKTVFINFWATWCKPCVEEMSSIEKAQAILKNENVIFLLASSESIEEIKAFRSNHSYQFTYVHLQNPETLNLQALPTTFIINPNGKLVFSEMGSRNWDETANINLIKNIIKQHE
jgi:peroxiredoxin